VKPVAAYLDRLFEIRASRRGTPELSYRAALENLLNAVGAELDPAVRATAELADTGSGRPDFGLAKAKSGNLRAVVEVKALGESVPETAGGEQVTRNGKRYGSRRMLPRKPRARLHSPPNLLVCLLHCACLRRVRARKHLAVRLAEGIG